MAPMAKVVYPTPPPTTNNLTTRQRSLLLRKAKKIEQILGYPPHLIDTLSGGSDGATASSPPITTLSKSRPSIDSASSTFVCPESLDKDGASWLSHPQGRKSSLLASHANGLNQIPLLRVASKSLHLELTAVTNWSAKPTISMNVTEQFQESLGACTPSPPDLDLPLKFTIPTSHTHRKAKMDRIRKRLGSEVPYEVVFPENVESRSHDSPGNAIPRSNVVPKLDRPLPTLPDPSHSEPIVDETKRLKDRLSLILECPDESSQEFTTDFWRTKDGTTKRRNSAVSESAYSQNSGHTLKRPRSYRKPPPPMLDASICSF